MARRTITPVAIRSSVAIRSTVAALRAITVFGILLTAACHGAPEVASGPEAVTDTVDGVPRLTYAGTGGPTLHWSMDTLAVIGDIMGTDEHYMLGRVSATGLAGDDAGDVYVLDSDAFHVLSYDSAGAYLATYGRQGNGPGELGQPAAVGVGPGDTVWVQGMTTRRLTGFPIGGGDARTITLPGKQFFLPPLAAVPGGFLTQGYPMTTLPRPGQEQEASSDVMPLVSVGPEGATADTLWSRPAPKRDLVQVQVSGRTAIMLVTPTFEPTLRWDAFADGSIAIASDSSYTIHLLRPDGSEWMRIARDLPPVPVGDDERELARNRIREAAGHGDMPDNPTMRQMMEKRVETMTFAAAIPRITGIRVDGSDRIWVGVSLSLPDSTQRIDVFERDGSLLGTIEDMRQLPATFFGSDRAAALHTDPDTDVQQVVVMRLREGAGE